MGQHSLPANKKKPFSEKDERGLGASQHGIGEHRMASHRETSRNAPLGVEDFEPHAVKKQVAPVMGRDESLSENGDSDPVRESSIYKIAEQLIAEALKLVQRTSEEATKEAEAKAAKIHTDAEVEAREQVLSPARAEADTKSNAIIADAEQKAQGILKSAAKEAREIAQAAKQEADRIKSAVEIMVRTLTDIATAEIESALNAINKPVAAADRWGKRTEDELEAATESIPQEEGAGLEQKLTEVR